MQSKEERGRQWLGAKADTESGQARLLTALLMNDYIQSVNNLGMIKEAFANSFNSELFIRLDIFNARERGAILFAKLTVDEALEKLQPAGNQDLCNALHDLSNITGHLFNTKIPSAEDVRKLLQIVNNILDLDDAVFTDKALAANLLFTLFFILNLGEPTLQSLNAWALKMVSWVIPIAEIRENVETLLQKAEAKASMLAPKPEGVEELNVIGLAQACFNQQSLSLLTAESDEQARNTDELVVQKKLARVEEVMSQTSAGLLNLMTLRSNNQKLGAKIKSLKAFLTAVIENESRVSGRLYFLDLLNNNFTAYQLLLETLPEQEKEIFEAMVNQLTKVSEEKNLSQQLSYGLSWLAVPVTHSYRYITPQKIQDVAINVMPSTRDSECKRALKLLLTQTLDQLNSTMQAQHEEITRINNQLFQQNNEIKQQVLSESDENLLLLQKSVTLTEQAVHTYNSLLHSARKNMEFLRQHQAEAETLAHFIQVHNTFWVKISNFFAQICWLFKTDAALMVDTVTRCHTKLDQLNRKYQQAIDSALKQIEQDEHVDTNIKKQLRRQFNTEIDREYKEPYNRLTGNRSIRLLVKNLERLFATNPQPLQPVLESKEAVESLEELSFNY